MTPKEKALELCNKFMICNSYQAIVWHNAKSCVLILVNEMLNNFLSNKTTKYGRERYHFWQQVKQEIELL